MIPYVEQPSFRIGPITVHAFGLIVATAVFAGFALGRRRFRQLGLDDRVGEALAGYAVVGGFLGAHLFSVLFYFPREVREHPFLLLKVWEDVSSFGGIFGGLLGIWWYFHNKASAIDRPTRWRYVDAVAYVFPMTLAIGRLACSVAHDHPGTVTRFPLAVSLESAAAQRYVSEVYRAAGRLAELPVASTFGRLGFHDLGWYEALYLGGVVVPVTWVLGRKPRAPGAFLALFLALYLPVRFALDFLRVSDVRYGGLTPAQWAALPLAVVAARWLVVARHQRAAITGP